MTVKDASSDMTHSFLPASWAGNTHEETNVLPIGNREEEEKCFLNRHTDSLETRQVLYDKVLLSRQRPSLEAKKGQMRLLAI